MTLIIGALVNDGDIAYIVGLDEPVTQYVKLRVESDDISAFEHINDADCWGRLEWTADDHDYWPTRSRRPNIDDPVDRAHARIVQRDVHHHLWWWPTLSVWGTPRAEWARASDETFNEVQRLLEEGFYSVGLELHETLTDSQGNTHDVIVTQAWLGGIDCQSQDYLETIVADLWAELVP